MREEATEGIHDIINSQQPEQITPQELNQPSTQQTTSDEDIVNEKKVAEILHVSEMAIKGLNYECGHIVSRNGDLLHVEHGQTGFVNPPVELIRDNILTHNHPSGTCAFSLNDVKSIIAHDGAEIRAVTKDGRLVSLRRGEDGWNPLLGDEMAKAGLSNSGVLLKSGGIVLRRYGRGYAEKQRLEIAENLLNGWLRDNAPKFGALFTEGVI